MINLPERVIADLRRIAGEYGVRRLALFGSRARGTHRPKSDIDLAVWGCERFPSFALDVDEKVWTLLPFDVVNMDDGLLPELADEIERDAVTIYEKV